MPRKKIIWAVVTLSFLGLVISGYLTWYGFTVPTDVCPLSQSGCSAVLSSPYAKIRGVPTAVLGVTWFLVSGLLGTLALTDEKWFKLLLVWSLAGLVGVLGLVYVEIFLIGEICLFCTFAHAIEVAIVALTLTAWVGK